MGKLSKNVYLKLGTTYWHGKDTHFLPISYPFPTHFLLSFVHSLDNFSPIFFGTWQIDIPLPSSYKPVWNTVHIKHYNVTPYYVHNCVHRFRVWVRRRHMWICGPWEFWMVPDTNNWAQEDAAVKNRKDSFTSSMVFNT